MEKPTISIITVTYNCQDTLEETILSIINQTYSNIEYLVIDGGSTDGTVDIIKKYQDKISYWISEPDKGIYDAMNKGIDKATGEWVNFMNAGDSFFEKKTLDKVVLKMDNPSSLYYGDVYMTDVRRIYWGQFNKIKLAVSNICHQAIFYPKHIYREYHFNIAYAIYADYYYNIEISPVCKFIYLDETISIYNYYGFSSSQEDPNFDKIIDKHIVKKLGIIPFLIRKITNIIFLIKNMI